jgi:glycosyltransferase involved in cell wall biosynthesis
MGEPGLVSIICLAYGQARWVAEALESVLAQTYRPLELVVVDDASPDGSAAAIRRWLLVARQQPAFQSLAQVVFLPLPRNVGNCRAFNLALRHARGEYVIDLAADDVLLPNRVGTQVAALAQLSAHYGVAFSDVQLVDGHSRPLGTYYARDARGHLRRPVPTGDVYRFVVGLQYISAPSMMVRRQVLDQLGGYDEALSYEDYDFWVRSARHFHYLFQDAVLTQKRQLASSHRGGFYQKGHSPHLASTLAVCQKAARLNQNDQENQNLAISVRHHLRLSLFTENFGLVAQFAQLLREMGHFRWTDQAWVALAKARIGLYGYYRAWHKLRNWHQSFAKHTPVL